MRITCVILTLLLLAHTAQGQLVKKYPIGNSGCSASFFCDPSPFDLSKSPDSSDVVTGECTQGDMTYGVICVQLRQPINDADASEKTVITYLDYLKTTLDITTSAPYGKGQRLRGRPDSRGILDYWQTKEGEHWKLKGWTDGYYIVVMYTFSKKKINENKADMFINSLILPTR